ncbi:hypothetical protein MACH26_07790 [Planctobacterium marinum]|uniref:Uncharacterized protein n=2 Tax=Planctobacterium marinum TaxID=1631968 RepID=A0AA48HE22_9ALTE|nr:hypothetical protein MACH26_07790 [Planctobacterium marinum]
MMHSNTEHSAMSHADIKHASVHHHEISHEEMQHHHAQMSSSDEHCASECECPAGTCNGFSWLAVEPLGMSNNVLNATIQSFTQSHYNLIQTSLYRPPIFA